MFKSNWNAYETGHPAAHNQIAARLNRVRYASDYNSLNAAVDAAKSQTGRGGVLFLAPGTYTIDEPLLLPRSGATPSEVVHLVGSGRYQTIIQGSASFPENRALIEWEDEAVQNYEQRIAHLSLALPNVAGVKAIQFKLTDRSSWSAVNAERATIDLEELYISAHNDYHQTLIELQGINSGATLRGIYGDPALGNGTYDTLLLKTDTDFEGLHPGGADAPGLFKCTIENLFSMVRRGGLSSLFDGRLMRSTFSNAFCDGGRDNSCYTFRNSLASVLTNLSTEGRGEKPGYLFNNCHFMQARQLGIGTPDQVGSDGVGNGLELVNCADCEFDTRFAMAGQPVFSSKGVKVVSIDADSKRNIFRRWGIVATDSADEFTVLGTENRVEYINVTNNTSGVIVSA